MDRQRPTDRLHCVNPRTSEVQFPEHPPLIHQISFYKPHRAFFSVASHGNVAQGNVHVLELSVGELWRMRRDIVTMWTGLLKRMTIPLLPTVIFWRTEHPETRGNEDVCKNWYILTKISQTL